jgi:hypothetical protein
MRNAAATGQGARLSPFPGLPAFEYNHWRVFFERGRETRSLVRLVAMYRAVLLYADSGVGKSSLVNAGLVPRSYEEGYQPYTLKLQPRPKREFLLARVKEESASTPGMPPPKSQLPKAIAAGRLIVWANENGARGDDQPVPLLILDQFEEVITLFEDGGTALRKDAGKLTQARIFDALVSLINDPTLRVKLVLSFREDFLAKLTPLFQRCPGLSDQYLRLEPLKTTQVKKLVRGPFDAFPGKYSPEISPQVAQTIEAQFAKRSTDGTINPSEVQIVCQSLSEGSVMRYADDLPYQTDAQQFVSEPQQGRGSSALNSQPDNARLPEAGRIAVPNEEQSGVGKPETNDQLTKLFREHDIVARILEGYFYNSIDSLRVAQKGPAVALLVRLITGSGTRNVVSKEDLLMQVSAEYDYDKDALLGILDQLEKMRLIRQERRHNLSFYEIVSEFLIDAIKDLREDLRELAELQRKEQPFGHFIDLASGDAHPMLGDYALVGRGIPREVDGAINFPTRFVSRVHLLILRSHHVFDVRSTNGTTLNSRALNPEDFRKMEDGDILVLADMKILRFQAGPHRKPDLLPVRAMGDQQARGLFIDGARRNVTALTPAEYFLKHNPETGLRLGLESGRGCVARLAVPPEGDLALEVLREDVEFLAYLKRHEGNFGWVRWRVPPRQSFDPTGAHFSSNGHPFQIVGLAPPEDDAGEKEAPIAGNGLPR